MDLGQSFRPDLRGQYLPFFGLPEWGPLATREIAVHEKGQEKERQRRLLRAKKFRCLYLDLPKGAIWFLKGVNLLSFRV